MIFNFLTTQSIGRWERRVKKREVVWHILATYGQTTRKTAGWERYSLLMTWRIVGATAPTPWSLRVSIYYTMRQKYMTWNEIETKSRFEFVFISSLENMMSCRVVFVFTNREKMDTIEHVFVAFFVFFVFVVLYMIKYKLNKLMVM